MSRVNEAMIISKKIQKEIDKLKKLNFSISARYESICVFDNEIKPEINENLIEKEIDYGNQVIFSFDCYHYNKN